jgi:hydroxypyruvate isomerase
MPLSRRTWIQSTAFAGTAAMTAAARADDSPTVRNGRIQQSLVNWCYEPYWKNFRDFCQVAVDLGCKSIELGDPKDWPTLKEFGLTCAIAGSHGFTVGFNNRGEWEQCIKAIRGRIDQCKEFGIKRIITFTGMANGLSKEEGADNCVEGLKQIVGYAEEKDVTLCLEMLNSRDDSHPMKGHPGYQGDHTDYCIDIIKRVGSPNLKLLFDIYHVQIMDGDVIRRIRQHKDYLGHIHTAGNPGRGELNEAQEINYPAVMQALLDIGYDGYVAQEFIPTGDALAGLKQAVALCDV